MSWICVHWRGAGSPCPGPGAGEQDLSLDVLRSPGAITCQLETAGERRTRALCGGRAVKEVVYGALHGNHSWFCCLRAPIATLDGPNPDLFPFSTK